MLYCLKPEKVARKGKRMNHLRLQVAAVFNNASFRKILKILLIYHIVMLAFALLAAAAEGWVVKEALWWASVTATTVGYGDMYPVTDLGRLCGHVLSHSVLLVIAPLIVYEFLNVLVKDEHKFRHEEQEELKNKVRDMHQMLGKIALKLGMTEHEVIETLDTEDCEDEQ